jgi:hypothetical protein
MSVQIIFMAQQDFQRDSQDLGGKRVVYNFGVTEDIVLRQGDRPYSTMRALTVNPDRNKCQVVRF